MTLPTPTLITWSILLAVYGVILLLERRKPRCPGCGVRTNGGTCRWCRSRRLRARARSWQTR